MRCSTCNSPIDARRNQRKHCSYDPHSQIRHLQLREVKTRAQEHTARFLFWLAQDGGDCGPRCSQLGCVDGAAEALELTSPSVGGSGSRWHAQVLARPPYWCADLVR